MALRPGLIRVLVKWGQYNPRIFIVRDPKKARMWRMLSLQERTMWNGAYGIRVESISEGV